MARARRSGRGPDYDWNSLVDTGTALTTAQGAIGGGFSAAQALTLMRCRGEIILEATPDASGDSDVVGLGLIIVSGDAFVVGGASLPGPISDASASWLWHRFVCLEASTNALDGSHILTNRIIEVDSKAMRKMKPNDTLALVGELSTGEFAAVTALSGIRFLVAA